MSDQFFLSSYPTDSTTDLKDALKSSSGDELSPSGFPVFSSHGIGAQISYF